MKLLMLKGLPASGKTTYARKLAQDGWKRVNKDDLRAMLDDSKWSGKNEKMVVGIRDDIIRKALGSGKSVVVDDTNFAPIHKERLHVLANELGATFETKFFDASLEECIQRDLKRLNSVGKDVIVRMYKEYLKPKPEVYIPNKLMEPTIVCDIDGTLAHMVDRGPYDWNRVGEDTLDLQIASLLGILKGMYQVILLSGRDSVCRPETEQWLATNNVSYDELYMRGAGDNRKDSIVKKELLVNYVLPSARIEFILDDRNQVVEMWRQMGLKVLQVAEGDF